MIELHVGRPRRLTVTTIARTSLRPVVWIGMLVAGVAFGLERLLSKPSTMAGAAAHARVRAVEGKPVSRS